MTREKRWDYLLLCIKRKKRGLGESFVRFGEVIGISLITNQGGNGVRAAAVRVW